jgi:hypothetical protein
MPPNDSQSSGQRDLNNKNHMLDLSTGTRIYVRSRLHDKGKKIRNYTPFFRPDGTLPTDGLIKKTTEPIPIKRRLS